MKNQVNNCMNPQGLNLDKYEVLEDESDVPNIEQIEEIDDENGSYVKVYFDDKTVARSCSHGRLTDEYLESMKNCQTLLKKAHGYMKQNMWIGRNIHLGGMYETAMMLSSVSKLLHTTAQCMHTDMMERFDND